MFDLSGVEAAGSLLADGEYNITCESAELKDTKKGGAMISCRFSVEGRDQKLFQLFNVKNPPDHVPVAGKKSGAEIGLAQLKAFLRASGYANPERLEDVWELTGLKCKAKIKTAFSEYRQEDESKITQFKPLDGAVKAVAPSATAATPF